MVLREAKVLSTSPRLCPPCSKSSTTNKFLSLVSCVDPADRGKKESLTPQSAPPTYKQGLTWSPHILPQFPWVRAGEWQGIHLHKQLSAHVANAK